MSVKEVTYFKVECDEVGCDKNTGNIGSEYSAWGTRGAALDDWYDDGGIATEDGKTFCEKHRTGRVCADCTEVRPGIVKDVDGEYRCPECAAEMRNPCEIARNRERMNSRPYCNIHGRVVEDGATQCSDADVFAAR